MRYKVGDKVRIKSLEWYNSADKNIFGYISNIENDNSFVSDMVRYCGMDAKISSVNTNYYIIDIDGGDWYWCDWMFDESFSNKEESIDYDYEQLKEIAIELIRANVSPSVVAFRAKEIYKELKTK